MKPVRIAKDLQRTALLIHLLDSRSGIDESMNPLLKESDHSGWMFACEVGLLNARLLYLRSVHLLCYYSGVSFLSFEQMLARCPVSYARKRRDWISEDGGTYDSTDSPWEIALDCKIDALISDIENAPDLLSDHNRIDNDGATPKASGLLDTSHTDSAMQSASIWQRIAHESIMDRLCKEISPGKHRCRPCKKCFKGSEFVRKHLRNRHSDLIDEETSKLRRKQTLKAYVSDPDRVDAHTFERSEHAPPPSPHHFHHRRRPHYPRYPHYPHYRRRHHHFDHSHSHSRSLRTYKDVSHPTDDSIDYGFGDSSSKLTFGL